MSGPEGARGIVRMGGGHAEQRVDRVADELLHRAALGGDELRELAERPVEGPLQRSAPSSSVNVVDPTTSTNSAVTTRRSSRCSRMGSFPGSRGAGHPSRRWKAGTTSVASAASWSSIRSGGHIGRRMNLEVPPARRLQVLPHSRGRAERRAAREGRVVDAAARV